jgi:hypothetical protein
MTFDVLETIPTRAQYPWERRYEAFCLCRNCVRSTTFAIRQKADADEDYLAEHDPPTSISGSLNQFFEVDGFICLKDMGALAAPEFVPDEIANAFHEGATSVVTNCPNAAAAMFRLVIDLTTRPLQPDSNDPNGPNSKVRRDLGLRLPWLFENGRLPKDLEDLSHCIREDGNDGAHQGTLNKSDALDLQDFATVLLERLFTEPERLRLAAERRAERRAGTNRP